MRCKPAVFRSRLYRLGAFADDMPDIAEAHNDDADAAADDDDDDNDNGPDEAGPPPPPFERTLKVP